MSNRLHKIAPAIPGFIVRGIRTNRSSVEIEKFPEAYEAPDGGPSCSSCHRGGGRSTITGTDLAAGVLLPSA